MVLEYFVFFCNLSPFLYVKGIWLLHSYASYKACIALTINTWFWLVSVLLFIFFFFLVTFVCWWCLRSLFGIQYRILNYKTGIWGPRCSSYYFFMNIIQDFYISLSDKHNQSHDNLLGFFLNWNIFPPYSPVEYL